MSKIFLAPSLLLCLLIVGCTGNHIDYLRTRGIAQPTAEKFTHCYNYGCQKRFSVSLPEQTQKKLTKIFTPEAKTADEEQQMISKAIQTFEKDLGAITGTENDKGGTFRLYQTDDPKSRTFQQDCIDESTNTTTYLTLLDTMNFLKFHRPIYPANRQPFLSGGPWWHQTATIQNIETNDKYAVDSWFKDNGHPAFVVPLKEWKNGWRPPKPKEKE